MLFLLLCFLKIACLTSACIFIIWMRIFWAELNLMIESYFRFFFSDCCWQVAAGCVDLRRCSTLAPSPLSILPLFQVGARKKEGKPGQTRTAESFAEGADTSIVSEVASGNQDCFCEEWSVGFCRALRSRRSPPYGDLTAPSRWTESLVWLRACGGLWELDVRRRCWSLQNCFSEEEMLYE